MHTSSCTDSSESENINVPTCHLNLVVFGLSSIHKAFLCGLVQEVIIIVVYHPNIARSYYFLLKWWRLHCSIIYIQEKANSTPLLQYDSTPLSHYPHPGIEGIGDKNHQLCIFCLEQVQKLRFSHFNMMHCFWPRLRLLSAHCRCSPLLTHILVTFIMCMSIVKFILKILFW